MKQASDFETDAVFRGNHRLLMVFDDGRVQVESLCESTAPLPSVPVVRMALIMSG
jgi:hypothetical protein